jgi:hypothetical protein
MVAEQLVGCLLHLGQAHSLQPAPEAETEIMTPGYHSTTKSRIKKKLGRTPIFLWSCLLAELVTYYVDIIKVLEITDGGNGLLY